MTAPTRRLHGGWVLGFFTTRVLNGRQKIEQPKAAWNKSYAAIQCISNYQEHEGTSSGAVRIGMRLVCAPPVCLFPTGPYFLCSHLSVCSSYQKDRARYMKMTTPTRNPFRLKFCGLFERVFLVSQIFEQIF